MLGRRVVADPRVAGVPGARGALDVVQLVRRQIADGFPVQMQLLHDFLLMDAGGLLPLGDLSASK